MFKVNEKIVYVPNDTIGNHYCDELEYYRTYTISDVKTVRTFGTNNYGKKHTLIVLKECDHIYQEKYFISLKEYRKRKLNKLCLK